MAIVTDSEGVYYDIPDLHKYQISADTTLAPTKGGARVIQICSSDLANAVQAQSAQGGQQTLVRDNLVINLTPKGLVNAQSASGRGGLPPGIKKVALYLPESGTTTVLGQSIASSSEALGDPLAGCRKLMEFQLDDETPTDHDVQPLMIIQVCSPKEEGGVTAQSYGSSSDGMGGLIIGAVMVLAVVWGTLDPDRAVPLFETLTHAILPLVIPA